MKVAVTSEGKEMNSQVDPRFGRAAWYVVVDSDTGESEFIDNSDVASASHGAGPQAAKRIAELGVDAVITGHCGPNAFRALNAAGIKVYTNAEGTVSDAVEMMKKGELEASQNPDVRGHWQGMK